MKSNLLRDERKQHGWSQADVAQALGITTKMVIRWELGHTVPFPYHRRKLSALFGKTVQELGLLSEGDENDAFEQTVSPLACQAPQPKHRSWLILLSRYTSRVLTPRVDATTY